MRQFVRVSACVLAMELAGLSFGGAGHLHAGAAAQSHASSTMSAANSPADDDFDDVTAYLHSLSARDALGLLWPVALVCAVLITLKIKSKRR